MNVAGFELPQTRAAPVQPQHELYRSTKNYDHSEGLSCCFRQWRAEHSHCKLVHGYALAFSFVFASRSLDQNNWCFDFGGMKEIRHWLHEMFDHTMLVAADDPERERLEALGHAGIVDIRVVPAVGCEAIAKQVFGHVARYVTQKTENRVWLESVHVKEHGGNSASYEA
jgi:6-pyruvoyltetrahydropterin/6-carboxytetrahydropterin synthase